MTDKYLFTIYDCKYNEKFDVLLSPDEIKELPFSQEKIDALKKELNK